MVLWKYFLLTLDKGPSFYGVVGATATIDRADALVYLDSGSPSLQNFANLIAEGKLAYDVPAEQVLYKGTPNHPTFMLSDVPSSDGS